MNFNSNCLSPLIGTYYFNNRYILYHIKMKMMKLLNRKTVDGKPMYKFHFSIPPKMINELGWTSSQEYMCNIKNGKLVIEKIRRKK